MKKSLKRLLTTRTIIVITVILVAIAGYLLVTSGSKKSSNQLLSVSRQTIIEEVSVTGNTKPVTDAELAFASGGRIAVVNAKTGDHVIKGQLLASLDTA